MRMSKMLELINQYGACEKCGNELIGGGEGAIEVTDFEFKRSCKCGWKVEIQENKGVTA